MELVVFLSLEVRVRKGVSVRVRPRAPNTVMDWEFDSPRVADRYRARWSIYFQQYLQVVELAYTAD